MKRLLKHFVIDSVSLYLISQTVSGLVFEGGINTLLLTGLVLTLATFLIKPVINLLLLPLNLVTFGLFRWVAYTTTLYLVTVVVDGFKIAHFNFLGFNSYWFSIPQIYFTGILSLLAFSLLISFVSTTISWIMK